MAEEPLGILTGPVAADAVRHGWAARLGGGPLAFTHLRTSVGLTRPVSSIGCLPPVLSAPRPPWAGLRAPAVMGILNVTPDSFSDGGRALDHGAAIASGHSLLHDGADILDIGGESTRPRADPVSPEEEQRRILPVVAALAKAGARISVDTRHAATMARALDAGAAAINDVSGFGFDPAALATVARAGCPVVVMHMRGTPQSMAGLSVYADVARDVLAELTSRYEACLAAGVAPANIAIDPGFGFAKTKPQSRDLLRRLPLFFNLPCRILVGLSRKGFVGDMAGVDAAADRDPASLAAGMIALAAGADILRVHDVAATVQAVRVWRSMNQESGA